MSKTKITKTELYSLDISCTNIIKNSQRVGVVVVWNIYILLATCLFIRLTLSFLEWGVIHIDLDAVCFVNKDFHPFHFIFKLTDIFLITTIYFNAI